MIPDAGYTQENAARAMSQADLFIQQTRAQAAQQLSQPASAFTGGIGGAQPGIMSYATSKVGAFSGGFGAGMAQAAGQAFGGVANASAAAAAFATPGASQFGNVIEGARYAGGGAPPMTLAGMLTTAYAPKSLFPHAGMAFGMERGTRRELAREELGRRWTQGVRGGLHTVAHGATLGLSSYIMRRTGIEASYLTEMETERTLQNRLGFMRGGRYASASGFGVKRDFFTEGPGRSAMNVLQERAGTLQSQYGYGTEQMNMLTRTATGAIDATRVQQYASGGRGGMSAMGREIADIRDTAAQMAREMQMSEKEIQEFFGRLKGVMQITGEGVKKFQQENRRLSMQGPFSQKQVASMRMQFTQMGRQMYLGGADFGTEAMEQANRVAELRRSGVISAETLLREGGGLDPEAMARMVAQRLQQQAGLVQAGNFNQSLVLAGQNPGAYAGMMGGASFMQTQAALGATAARNPFALLQAQLDPDAVRRVTMQAPTIAYQRAQQMGQIFVGQNSEQIRAQKIRKFGQQMGFNVQTAQGLGQARTRYEEMEIQQESLVSSLEDVFQDAMSGAATRSHGEIRQMSSSLMGIMTETGESAGTMAKAMNTIQNDTDLQRRWSSGSAAGRTRLVREVLAQEEAADLSAQLGSDSESIGEALAKSPSKGIRKARNLARSLAKKGVAEDMISSALFGDLGNFRLSRKSLGMLGEDTAGDVYIRGEDMETNKLRNLERRKFEVDATGKMRLVTEQMTMSTEKIQREIERHGIKTEEELMEHLTSLSGWKKKKSKVVEDEDDLDETIRNEWADQLSRSGKRFSVESIRQAGMARNEWARARRKGAGVFDILRRGGLDVSKDMTQGLKDLLDADISDKKKFAEIRKDKRLKPLVDVIEGFSSGGVRDERDFRKMAGVIGPQEMKKFFREYAASEEGLKRLGGKSFQEFLGDRPMRQMNDLFQGMSDSEKQAFMNRTLTSAIEKSQRLVNETKRGDPGKPMHVLVTNEAEQKNNTVIGISF